MPSVRFAIRARFAVSARFAIRAASTDKPSAASNAAPALKSAAPPAARFKEADALKPRLAATARDTPGISEGTPSVMESKLLREARQAQGISTETKSNHFVKCK